MFFEKSLESFFRFLKILRKFKNISKKTAVFAREKWWAIEDLNL